MNCTLKKKERVFLITPEASKRLVLLYFTASYTRASLSLLMSLCQYKYSTILVAVHDKTLRLQKSRWMISTLFCTSIIRLQEFVLKHLMFITLRSRYIAWGELISTAGKPTHYRNKVMHSFEGKRALALIRALKLQARNNTNTNTHTKTKISTMDWLCAWREDRFLPIYIVLRIRRKAVYPAKVPFPSEKNQASIFS